MDNQAAREAVRKVVRMHGEYGWLRYSTHPEDVELLEKYLRKGGELAEDIRRFRQDMRELARNKGLSFEQACKQGFDWPWRTP